jgi:HEPN domain-containing protein
MNDRFSHARGWFRKGDSDLETAEKLLAGEGPYDTACFHAQQAAEKYLKGPLAFKEQPIPYIHDLNDLEQACATVEPGLALPLVSLAELTPYAVELRYDFEFWPEEDTAREAIETAERVRKAVLALVPAEARP